jgi:hypothetical protein
LTSVTTPFSWNCARARFRTSRTSGSPAFGEYEGETGAAADVEQAGACGYRGRVEDRLEQRLVVRLG